MPIPTLSSVPTRFAAGDTIKILLSILEFPADQWGLAISLRGPGDFTASAVADGLNHKLTLNAADTAPLLPGQYLWALRFTNLTTSEVATRESGALIVTPNLFAAATPTAAAAIVANLEAAITKLSKKTSTSVSVNGLTYSLANISELYSLLQRAKADLAAERSALSGRRKSNLIKIRFGGV